MTIDDTLWEELAQTAMILAEALRECLKALECGGIDDLVQAAAHAKLALRIASGEERPEKWDRRND
jgi:hypothetical protein